MPLYSNSFTAPMSENVKLHESIYETIKIIGADETPLLSKIGTSSVKNPLQHSWLTDTLGAPKKNANAEITGLEEDTQNTVQKTSNALQIFKTEIMISEALMHAKQYGGNEMSYQTGKKAKEHKMDMEYALFGLGRDTDVKKSVFKEFVQGNGTKAGEMAGLFYYIAKGETAFTNGKRGNVLAFDASGDWKGKASALDEAKLNQILQVIWDSGATPKDVFIGASLKNAINKLASRMLGNEKKYNSTITSLETDFGVINFHLHRLLSDRYGLNDVLIAGDFEYMKHGLFISTKIDEVVTDKTAQAKRFYTQSTLEVRNADAFAIGVGLSA